MEIQPYVLVELEDFAPLSSPVKSSQRNKYTCFDASESFIVLGATSGGLYVFQRKPCLFLQLIPNTEGAITQVSISPNETMFAFSTVKGFVFLVDHSIGQDNVGGVRKVQVSSDHHGAQVTTFQWNQKSNDLYIGDDKGKISVVSVSFFMAKTIFQAPSFTLMELDSRVVQMDLCGNFLLVSTLTRSYICDTVQEQYKKIGSKPRNGIFGACFQQADSCNSLPNDESARANSQADGSLEGHNVELNNVRIFCARPGARLWEVGIGGDVVSTHKFGEVLSVPPVPVITVNPQPEFQPKPLAPAFTKLFCIGEQFILTYDQNSMYIMDPENAQVVLWSRLYQDATDVRIIGNVVYLWSGSLLALTLLTVEECLLTLFSARRLQNCIDLCLQHLHYLMEHAQLILPLAGLSKLVTSVPEEMMQLMEEIQRLAKKQEGRIQPPVNTFRRLETGMHVSGVREIGPEERKRLRDISGGMAVVRSRSASPRIQLRRLGAKAHVGAKGDGANRGHYPRGGDQVSLQTMDAASSSLPDLLETGIKREVSFSETANNNDPFQMKGDMKQSETFQATINSIGVISQKLVEGTMTIREKWQELEGRVRSFGRDSSVEALDFEEAEEVGNGGMGEEDEEVHAYEDEVIVLTRNRLLKKNFSSPETKELAEPKAVHPVLDLERVFELLRKVTVEGYELPSIHSLFDSILSAFVSFSKEKFGNLAVKDGGGDGASPKPKTESLLFPFRYYFTESMIAVIMNAIEVLVSSNDSSLWLEEKFGFSTNATADLHPAYKKCCPEQQAADDVCLCALLNPFLEIINPLRILSCMGKCSSPCRFLTWCKVVDLMIERPSERIATFFGNIGENSDLPGIPATFPFLLTEFHKVRETNCSMLLRNAPKIMLKERISLRHCLYITFWLCMDNNGQDWCSPLLSILLISSSDVAEDKIFQSCAINAFSKLNASIPAKVLCGCGFPHVGAISSSSPQYATIGVRLARQLWEDGRQEDCLRLCWSSGLWRWVVWFMHAEFLEKESVCVGTTGEKESSEWVPRDVLSPLGWNVARSQWEWGIIELLATLGDQWCLEEWLGEMSESAWRKLLDLRSDVLSGCCLGCRVLGRPPKAPGEASVVTSGITWTEIGVLMIESLGPETTCAVFMDCSSLDGVGQLDASFYKLCIVATVATSVSQEKRPPVQYLSRMLLRQDPKDVFSPEVSQLVKESLAVDSHSWGSGKYVTPLPPSHHRRGFTHHWGCHLSLGKNTPCPRCSLPLTSPVLLSSTPGGLLVLPCGHSLHAVCSRSTSKCPLGCPQVHAPSRRGSTSSEEGD